MIANLCAVLTEALDHQLDWMTQDAHPADMERTRLLYAEALTSLSIVVYGDGSMDVCCMATDPAAPLVLA